MKRTTKKQKSLFIWKKILFLQVHKMIEVSIKELTMITQKHYLKLPKNIGEDGIPD